MASTRRTRAPPIPYSWDIESDISSETETELYYLHPSDIVAWQNAHSSLRKAAAEVETEKLPRRGILA